MQSKTLVIYTGKGVATLRTKETVTERIRELCEAQRIQLARRKDVRDTVIDREYPSFREARAAGERAGFYTASSQQIVASGAQA